MALKTMTALFAAAMAAFAATRSAAVEVDGVAAIVGNEQILRSDIVAEMRRAGVSEMEFVEFRNRLIERKLILKAAEEAKMSMQDWVVENRVKEIIDNAFGGDRNKLTEMLMAQKMTFTEWRKSIRDDMIAGAMRWNVVDKNVTASPLEMQKEYETGKKKYALESKVTVSVILLNPERVGEGGEATVMELLKTKDFAAVAKQMSSDSHAADGGVWKDVVPSEQFQKEICDEIAKTPVGALSNWVDIQGWKFLLKKDGETEAKVRTFAEAYDDIEANVKEAKAKSLYEAWMSRLKANTYIRIIGN